MLSVLRVEKWDLGPGNVYVLKAASAVDQLPRALQELVPPRMLQLLNEFPTSFDECSRRSSHPALKAWLRLAAGSDATIRVYELPEGAGMPSKAWLNLDFGTRSTAGGLLPWHVLTDCQHGTPPACPPALAEVYASVGGLATQYGGSGTLIPPHEVAALSSMGERVGHLFDSDRGGELSIVDGRDWFAYFEADGDFLCYREDGLSRWFGMEWSADAKLRPTDQFIDALFQSLSDKTYFHG